MAVSGEHFISRGIQLIEIVWDNVYGFDYSPMKEIALSEPLVDTVELKAVVTDPCPVVTFDLYTVKSSCNHCMV